MRETMRPPSHAKVIVIDVITRIEAALLEPEDAERSIRAALHDAIIGLGGVGTDDAPTQLRLIEFEADRINVLGVERLKSRLAQARALMDSATTRIRESQCGLRSR
jgi:hypothetical protein